MQHPSYRTLHHKAGKSVCDGVAKLLLQQNYINVFTNIVSYQLVVSHNPTITSAKLFVGTLFLVHLFLSTAYSAVLTSLLAVPKVVIPVDSLEDLVKYGKIPWAASRGTAESRMFLVSNSIHPFLQSQFGFALLFLVSQTA